MRRPLFLNAVGEKAYIAKIKGLFGSSIMGYFPFNEPSGATCYDRSGLARNGAYVGVDLAQPGAGDGGTAPYFDGANDYAEPSNNVGGSMNKDEGTLMIWGKEQTPGDATNRYYIPITDGAGNYLWIRHVGANTVQLVSNFYTTNSAWHHFAITWSASGGNIARGYADGVKVGADMVMPVLASVNADTAIGVFAPWALSGYFLGWLAHAVYLNRPATAMEILQAASI